MRFIHFLIESRIWIALAAVCTGLQSLYELGLGLAFHPFLALVFFAALFDYNLHRLHTLWFYPLSFQSEKYRWVRENKHVFFAICIIACAGLVVSFFFMQTRLKTALLPLALLTLLYTLPFIQYKGRKIRLRDIPYAKIFVIALVWTGISVWLPYSLAPAQIQAGQVSVLILLRFLLFFGLSIPFDIHDLAADQKQGIKTLPMWLGVKKSIRLASFSLTLMALLALIFYTIQGQYALAAAYTVSGIAGLYLLHSRKASQHPLYLQGMMDGVIVLQAVLLIGLSTL